MQFGSGADPVLEECAFCGEKVTMQDRMMVDRETIHKGCFNCGMCGAKLQPGAAAMELSFYNRYGPRLYCSGHGGSCAMTPVAQKDAKLKEKGLNMKKFKKQQRAKK